MMRQAIFLIALSMPAWAATYYIDYETGDDANNGTTPGTPWKHYPMDARATGVAASTAIVAGDVLAPKGGVEYIASARRLFPVGAVGNPVIIDGALWGTGKAIEDGENQAYGAWWDNNAERGNFRIENIIYQDFGGYADASTIWDGITISSVDSGTDVLTSLAAHNLAVGNVVQFTVAGGTLPAPISGGTGSVQLYYVKTTPSDYSFTLSTSSGGATLNLTSAGSGTIKVWKPITNPLGARILDLSGGGENITFKGLEFNEIGQWQAKPPMSGANAGNGTAFWLESVNNVLVEDCHVRRTAKGWQILASPAKGKISDVTIADCSISQNVQWCVDIAPLAAGGVLENITIKNSKFFDYLEFDQGNWTGFGEKPHSNGIFIRTAGMSSTWTNLRIHGNEFYIDNPGASQGGTADIFISEGPSALIYNNIFFKTKKAQGAVVVDWFSAMPGQVVRVYNNTFYGSATWVRSRAETRALYRDMHFTNNLCVGNGGASNLIMVVQESGVPLYKSLNRNLYFHPSYAAAQNRMFIINNYAWATLANVQSMSAGRPNQFEWNSLYQNPLITDTVGNFAATNWRVLAGSPAIGMGENLSSFFTVDKDGNARPASGGWTVGAYEYDASPPADVTAPALFSAVIDSSGEELTVTMTENVVAVAAVHYTLSGGHTLGLTEANGTVIRFSVTPPTVDGETVTLSYISGAGRTEDAAGNLLATFLGAEVDNQSLETTPVPPRAAGRGASPRRVRR